MRAPLKTALASWAPSINIVIIIIITVKSYMQRKHEKLDNEHLWSPNLQMVQVHNASILHHEHYLSSCYQHDTIWSSVSHEGRKGTIRPWSWRRPRKAEKKRNSRNTGKLQYQNDQTVWSKSKRERVLNWWRGFN